MAENSFKQSIEEARGGIRSLSGELENLDKKILETAKLARENLGAMANDNTASAINKKMKAQEEYLTSLKKEVAEQEKILKQKEKAQKKLRTIEEQEALQLEKARALRRKAMAERENQLARQIAAEKKAAQEQKKSIQAKINMNNSLRKQEEKQQAWQFKQMAKSTREEKRMLAQQKKIKQAREAAISKQMTGRMVEYVNSIGKTNTGLKQMGAYYKELEREANKLAKAENKVKQAREKDISKKLTGQMVESVNAIGKQSDAIKKLNADYKEWEKSSLKVQKAQEKAANQDARQRVNQAALAKNAEMYARANSRIVGSFKKLVAQRDLAKKKLQDAMAKEKQNEKQIKKLQREYDKLADKVNKVNDATARYGNKTMRGMLGNMQQMTRGLRNLAYAFGWMGGIYMFADLAKQGFQLAKTLDSLNFAMRTVIKNSEELARAQVFLDDITEKYGASIVTTTERYTKFLAASQQAGVSLKDTEDIFRTMTKAAGALGLKTHELEGVYLALEQMLSKGKVTTEELRRQLGERLPGAFGIMAEALDVSVVKLDDMLRKGQVLSHEALPAFAKAAEEAYGIKQLDRVENLNAAHQRFMNAWVKMVGSITKSEGPVSNALIGILDTITKVVGGFEMLNDTMDKAFNRGKTLGASEFSKYMEKEMDVWRDINKKRLEAMKEAGDLSAIAMAERSEMKRIGQERLKFLQEEYNSYSAKLAELQREALDDVDAFPRAVNPVSGLWDIFSDKDRDNQINKMTEMTTKYKAMIKAAREAAGLSQEDLLVLAKDEDLNNVVHMNKAVDQYQGRLKKLKAFRQSMDDSGDFNEATILAIDEEILKVQELVDLYTVRLQRASMGDKGYWDFTTGFDTKAIDRGRTYADVMADIAHQKKLLDESLKEEAPEILDKIDELEKEAEAWERSNEAKKGSKRVLKDTLKWFEEEKSRLEDQRDRLAQSSSEREEYNIKIEETEEKIRKLTRAFTDLEKHFVGEHGFDFSMEGTGGGLLGDNEDKMILQFQKFQDMANNLEVDPIEFSFTYDNKIDLVKELMDSGDIERLENMNEQILQKNKDRAEQEIENLRKYLEARAETYGEFDQARFDEFKTQKDLELEALEESLSAEEEAVRHSYEQRKQLIEDFNQAKLDLVEAGIEAIGDRRVADIEDEIEKNREYYAEILASEKFTEDQRALIEAQRDKREIQLEKKKRRREKEAFLMKQGFALAEIYLNLAQSLSMIQLAAQKYMAELPFPFNITMATQHIATNKPIAIATAATSTGMVLAQSIPQLYTGTENAPEGWALVDELRPEVHTDKHGNVKSFGESGPNFRYLEQGDKIFPSREKYFSQNNSVENSVFRMNMESNGKQLTDSQVDRALISEIGRLRGSNQKVWNEVKKLASRPIHVNNEVTIKDNKPY